MRSDVLPLILDDAIDYAMALFAENDLAELPVVSPPGAGTGTGKERCGSVMLIELIDKRPPSTSGSGIANCAIRWRTHADPTSFQNRRDLICC